MRQHDPGDAPLFGKHLSVPAGKASLLQEYAGAEAELVPEEPDEIPMSEADGACLSMLPAEATLETPGALLNLINTLVGVGVLSVPFAFRLSGYLALPLLLVVIGITAITAKHVGSALKIAGRDPRAAQYPPEARDYGFLATIAFGDSASRLLGTVTTLEIWSALCTFLVMSGVNSSIVVPSLGSMRAVIASSVLTAALHFVPMTWFSYLSAVSSLALFVAGAALIGSSLDMPDGWAQPPLTLTKLQLLNIPKATGLLLFCFAGHPCFPMVYQCMKNRRAWPKVIDGSYPFALLYYGGLGIYAYIIYGEATEAAFTQSLAEHSIFWSHLAVAAFQAKILLSAPILLKATMISFWPPEIGQEWPRRRVLGFLALVLATTVVSVVFAKDVDALASLTGSLFITTTSIIFPVAVHRRLVKLRGYGDDIQGTCAVARDYFMILFGVVLGITGTYSAILGLVAGRSG